METRFEAECTRALVGSAGWKTFFLLELKTRFKQEKYGSHTGNVQEHNWNIIFFIAAMTFHLRTLFQNEINRTVIL